MTFKDIPGFEGFYQCSDAGVIRSIDRYVKQHHGRQLKRGKELKQAVDKLGYYNCALSVNNNLRSFKVHRLVAMTFIPNPHNYPEVNHIDCDKSNNALSNLEWCNRKMNMDHAYKNKLVPSLSGDRNGNTAIKEADRPKVFELHQSGMNAVQIAKLFNCSFHTIYRILTPEKYKRL